MRRRVIYRRRPRYETAGDRLREEKVGAVIRQISGCNVRKRPPSDDIDFELLFPDRVVLAEIKTRTIPKTKYSDYLISLRKANIGKSLNAILIVQWTDEIGWLPFNSPHTVGTGGRWDRNDPHDVEKIAYYPIANFLPLNEL